MLFQTVTVYKPCRVGFVIDIYSYVTVIRIKKQITISVAPAGRHIIAEQQSLTVPN